MKHTGCKITVLLILVIILCQVFAFDALATSSGSDIDSVTSISDVRVDLRFTYINYTNTDLGIANGVANFEAALSCSYTSTESCSATAYLQRRPIGGTTWTIIATYTDPGTFYATAYGSENVPSGYQYRIMAKYTANGKNGGSETTYSYSKTVTVPAS